MPRETENMVGIINFFLNIITLINIKEFRLRFISTITLLFMFCIFLFLGNPFITILFCFLFSFTLFEFENLSSTLKKKSQLLKTLLLQIFLFFFTIFEINDYEILPNFINNFYLFLFVSVSINLLFFLNKKTNYIKTILSNLIILSFFSLISILQKPNGLSMILYIVILVSVMDMFAYLGGKLLGKNKIIPKISKGKTIEGTIIGLLFIIVMSLLIKDLMNFNITSSIIYGLMIGVLAFFGDLIESIFKRDVGVKDSGKLIPGHGGLMDRFDGYFLVIPFFYLSINLTVI